MNLLVEKTLLNSRLLQKLLFLSIDNLYMAPNDPGPTGTSKKKIQKLQQFYYRTIYYYQNIFFYK